MKVIVEGTLENITKKPDYQDKIGKYALQLKFERKMDNGYSMFDFKTITIPEDKLSNYENKLGQIVHVECGLIGKDITLYGI